MSGISTPAAAAMEWPRLQWSWHLAALALVVSLILALFQTDVSNAVQVWWNYPTYSHCFLILPISGWLLWRMRGELAQHSPALAPKFLFAVPVILVIWLAANFATINEVRQFAVIALVEVATLVLLGPWVFRAALFPMLYLFFLVPFGQYLIPPMQQFATAFTDAGLSLLNVPHFTQGTTIELTNGRFEIAEACAGLRFLIATLALGVLFAHMAYRTWPKAALFMAACIVVPLIGNGLRCLGIIELAHVTNNAAAVEADHLIYGWLFNSAILLVLMVIGIQFRDEITGPATVTARAGGSAFSPVRVSITAVVTLLCVATGPAFAAWHEGKPLVMHPETVTAQFGLDGWTDRALGSWRPMYNADSVLMTKLDSGGTSAGGERIDAAVAYYARNRDGRSLIATTNQLWDLSRWNQLEASDVSARIGSDSVRMKEALITSGVEQRLVWWTYWMDGAFTTSSLTIKLRQLKTAFTGNEAAALVAFSTPVDGAIEDARKRIQTGLAGLTAKKSRAIAASRSIVTGQ